MPTAQEPEIREHAPRSGKTTSPPAAPEGSAAAASAAPPTVTSAAAAAAQIAVRIAADPPAAPEPDGPAGLLLQSYLHGQLLTLLAEDPRVRANEPDGVHKMRVSTRRMRSALASYRRVLAAGPAGEMRSELKWLAGILGTARDAQVMRSRLHALMAGQPAELVLGPVQQHIDEELLGDYRSAHASVLAVLDGARYLRLLERLETLVAKPGFMPEADAPAAKMAARLLKRDRKRLHRQVRNARDAGGEELRSEFLHEARKDAKRLRYAAEVAQPVRAEGSAELIAGAEHIQKILGEHQDSVVSREYLRRWGAAAAGAGHNGFTYGRLHALEEERGTAARKRFRKAWAGFPRVV
ncbi:CHAD domain-containing protein [Arthrobacter sp. ATA002]|uniref:CHAD domain-containing protein n=1 Tax=Arthrobacter sp. ATA002 TaxID=2991715 RepID=UPI0022A79D00|nr:CHAD domain-containing protein [Arthrobacter sp. ATA002]WAP51604.1 CHAD domain-containing protein [Arthrobacter sp. ATA002]